tara:strand:- start:58 stop:396 length:339 start_codon:yes stop_codon:yes gene_type:complete
MATIEPIKGFRQFTKNEVVAVMEAKNAKLSEKIERELRLMQEKIHETVRESVRDQIELLNKRIERNSSDIRDMLKSSHDEQWKTKLEGLIQKNTENIKIMDNNIKTLDRSMQ